MATVFLRARLITGDGREFGDATVKVEGNRIVEVDTNGSRVEAEFTVDLDGRTLMPGLIDTHVHLVGGDKGMGFGDEAASFKMGDSIIKATLDGVGAAGRTLHAGITTVREVAAREYADVFLRDAQRRGDVEGPRMLATGPGICMTGGHGSFLDPSGVADSVGAVIRRVRELVANRVDVIKVVSADGPETLGEWWTVQLTGEEVAAAFAEARRLGRTTAAHAMGPEAIKNVVAAGVDTVEHGWYLNEESCRLMKKHGTYLIPTLGNVVDIIHDGPALQMPWAEMMAADEAAIFDRHQMAVELGVKIAMGSDCGGNEARKHGRNADELRCHVRCGMSPMQAIVSGTLEAARVMRMETQIGTIEQGKLADLIIVDGDPLDDIRLLVSGVIGVIQGGRVIRDDFGLLEGLRRESGARARQVAAA